MSISVPPSPLAFKLLSFEIAQSVRSFTHVAITGIPEVYEFLLAAGDFASLLADFAAYRESAKGA
ncbi:hypothetical protein [Pseudomonas sp. PDM31]|uniref:hypothetical protein n=1 Tax=Pseudomonas sp. PDM31 TaxID=2854778 RepID=UPI001C4578F9|nr:hypothetical protein [Pseudomonas sp. PDM31]MBV7476511.1 hypothetical protein [Pseudomonas sp. PDM31]